MRILHIIEFFNVFNFSSGVPAYDFPAWTIHCVQLLNVQIIFVICWKIVKIHPLTCLLFSRRFLRRSFRALWLLRLSAFVSFSFFCFALGLFSLSAVFRFFCQWIFSDWFVIHAVHLLRLPAEEFPIQGSILFTEFRYCLF